MQRGAARQVGIAAAAAAVALAAAALAGAAPAAHAQAGGPCGADQGCERVAVGALLARGEPFDEQRWAALGAAVDRFNGMQDGMAERVLIGLSRHDLDHGGGAAAVSAAHAGGAGPLYYLGPTFSGDVAGAAAYVGEHGLVAVSPSSSAASLAVPGDGIYRITAPVSREAAVMAGLIAAEGVRTVVPAAQNGEFGTSTLGAMTAAIGAAGIGTADPVRFDAGNASSWREALAGIDAALSAEPGAALLLVIGFEEDFGSMAAAAAGFESARSARWFVPSGAIIPPLALEGAAAEVAESARVTTLVIEDAAAGAGAREAVRAGMAAAGLNATSYDYSASDSVFVLGGAMRLAAAGGANVSAPEGAAAVRSNMLAAARLHVGALGDVRLDAAGDLRSPISYAVWEAGGDGAWSKSGAARAGDSFCGAGAAAAAAAANCTELGIIARNGSASDAAAAGAAMLAVDDYNSGLLEAGGGSGGAAPYIEARILGINASESSPARAAVASATGPAAYVGPSSDGDLASLRDAAAAAGVLLFSPASTDPSLAVAGDGVFRLAAAPPAAAAAAVLSKMRADGVAAAAIVAPGGNGSGASSAAWALSALAPSYGVRPVGIFAHAGGDAAAAAAGSALAADAAGPARAAVVVVAPSPAGIEGLAAAAAADGGGGTALQSARWYIVDAAGHTTVQAAGPALAALSGMTDVVSVHPRYDASAGGSGGAAGRIGYAVGHSAAPPSLLYSSYDAAILAAGALGTLPAGAAAGNATAAAAAAASVVPAAAAYEGILGDVELDAAGDLLPPAAYALRSAPAAPGAGWAAAGAVSAAPACSTPIARQSIGAGCTEVGVGALLARGEPFDEQRWAALGAAVDRFNGMQDGMAERVLIGLSRHDLDHGGGAAAVSAAHAGGAGPLYYLGPTFSGDVAGAAAYVGEHGLVAVSPSSSAASLAVPGDGIYRITAPVSREAAVMAGLIAAEGVRTVVPAAQNGEFGTSTLGAMTAAIGAAGIGTADPVRFDAGNASSWREALAGIDAALSAEPGAALLLVIGFEEDFGSMAAAAAGFESARSARWFVPSGAIIPPLALEGAAAEVAESARVTTLVIEDAAAGAGAREAVRAGMAAAGLNATSYDYSASDSVFVLGGAMRLAAAGGANVSAPEGAAAVRSNMLAAARLHVGALGDVRLDAAGDLRSPISYAVWEAGGDGAWSKSGAARAGDSFCGAGAAAAAAAANCTELGIIARNGSASDAAAAGAAMLAVDDYNSGLLEAGGGSGGAAPYIEARILGINASESSPARAAVASATGPAAYVGPSSDGDLASLRDAAAAAGVLLFSPASTDPSLAVAGDGVFRTAAAPRQAAAAALGAMRADGIGAAAVVAADGAEGAAGRALLSLAGSYEIGAAAVPWSSSAAAEAAAAAAAALPDAGTPARTAVVLADGAAAAAGAEGMAAAAADSEALRSARWYLVDSGGITSAAAAGPAVAALAAETSVSSVHAPYGSSAAGAEAAGRVGHAVGYADAPPLLLYSAYDAAMLAAGALGTLPAGSAAGDPAAAAAAAATVVPASAAYDGILDDAALGAAGDAVPPAAYARRAAPAAAGAGWSPAGAAPVDATCSVSIARPTIGLGDARAGGVSGTATQTVTNEGTVPLALSVQASGWSAAGSPALPASATELSTGSGFVRVKGGPEGVSVGTGQVAPGGSLDIDYRLNLGGQVAAAAAAAPLGAQLVQNMSYTATCSQ